MTLKILLIISLVILFTIMAGWAKNRLDILRWKRRLFGFEESSEKISEKDLESFPDLLKNYLRKVGVIGMSKHAHLRFKQIGTIRSDSNKKWLPFRANQFMSMKPGGFIWNARSFPLYITDSYFGGIGKVQINLLGLTNVKVLKNNETDQSALGRYFGELIWFPIGFMDDRIEWAVVNNSTLKGTITIDSLSFTAHFHFTEDGLIHSFTGKRFRDLILEDFRGKAENYVQMNGLLIPSEMTAIWELNSGQFEYFKASIKDYELTQL